MRKALRIAAWSIVVPLAIYSVFVCWVIWWIMRGQW